MLYVKIENGVLTDISEDILDSTYKGYKSEVALDMLRELRDTICYSVVNRSQFWFNTLTEEQTAELQEWYDLWLDVTSSLAIPTTPIWLQNLK